MNMAGGLPRRWRHLGPWTLALAGGVLLMDLGILVEPAGESTSWRALLQFDGPAIRAGEWWRLLTFNVVHWDARHLLLNLGVFLALGFLYEQEFGRWYPWFLLGAGAAVGVGLLIVFPDRHWRGLSGVILCELTAVLGLEWSRARRERGRWWLLLAGALVVLWLVHKWYTLPPIARG